MKPGNIFAKSPTAWIGFLLFGSIVFFRFVYPPVGILSWDVFGYYLYLPATFVYHDLKLTDIEWVQQIVEQYKTTSTLYQVTALPNGGWVMKYSMGIAILNAPAFFIAHLISGLTNFKADGFSLPYQYAWAISGLFYTAAGIWMFRKVMLEFFSENMTAILLIIIVLATNYFQLTSFDGYLSHNYTFTLYTFIVWFTIRWHKKPDWKSAAALGFTMGLVVLVRPSELVCIIIPLLWNISNYKSFNDKLMLLKSNYKHILILVSFALLASLPQLIYWKYSSGHWLFYSYNNAGEGFDFTHPYIGEVLFSFRKGWFVYTPIMIFAIIGFISTYKFNKAVFYSVLLYFIVNLYVVSSWTCWWYAGGSYSQRALLSSYVILAIPLGYFMVQINKLNKWYTCLFRIVFGLLLLLNIFQTWQWAVGIIDRTRMTKAYYFATFGKTSCTEEDKKLLLIERANDASEELKNESDYSKRIATKFDFENKTDQELQLSSDTVFEGTYSQKLDSGHPYSKAFEMTFSDITSKEYAWIRAQVQVFPTDTIHENYGSLVLTFQHKGEPYQYRAISISDKRFAMKPGVWNTMSVDYLTPEIRSKTDSIKIYFWLQGQKPIFIDNLTITIFD